MAGYTGGHRFDAADIPSFKGEALAFFCGGFWQHWQSQDVWCPLAEFGRRRVHEMWWLSYTFGGSDADLFSHDGKNRPRCDSICISSFAAEA